MLATNDLGLGGRRGLHTLATSHITCCFAGTFQRGNAPLAPNPC